MAKNTPRPSSPLTEMMERFGGELPPALRGRGIEEGAAREAAAIQAWEASMTAREAREALRRLNLIANSAAPAAELHSAVEAEADRRGWEAEEVFRGLRALAKEDEYVPRKAARKAAQAAREADREAACKAAQAAREAREAREARKAADREAIAAKMAATRTRRGPKKVGSTIPKF